MNKPIDWEAIRKRMILAGFQIGVNPSEPTPPTSNWILTSGFWNDEGLWIDEEVWID
jgi:hypothetical protein